MKLSKKRTKNKEELDDFSGAKKRRKKPPELKLKIDFQFIDIDGTKHKPPNARLKINADNGVSFLVKVEEGWKPIKAKLDYLKVKYERKVLDISRKVSRKPT